MLKVLRLGWLVAILALPVMAQRQGPWDCSRSYVSPAAVTSSGVVQLIAPPTGQMLRICQVSIYVIQPSTPANFGLVYGTGTSCGTGQGNQTPQWTGVASSAQTYASNVPYGTTWWVPYGNGLCLKLSANVTSAQVEIRYDAY